MDRGGFDATRRPRPPFVARPAAECARRVAKIAGLTLRPEETVGTTQPFDVFGRLLRRALDASAPDASLELQVFRAEGVQGAVVAKFFPEALAESLHAVYVPPGIDEDGSIAERLHAAVATHDGLVPVTDPAEQRALLAVLQQVLDRGAAANDDAPPPDPDAAPARVEFGPLEALQALDEAESRADAVDAGTEFDAGDADEDDDDEDEEDADAADDDGGVTDFDSEHASFRAIALDVLSGVPAPHGSAPEIADTFEVWGYRHDPAATVVLRWYDAGDALAFAALCPAAEEFDVERFAAAAYTLLATKLPDAVERRASGRLSDLEPLETGAAMARLGRALGLEHTRDVREFTTPLLGAPSEDALDAFESMRLLDPRAPLPAAAVLADIADTVLEYGVEVLWTRRKEREGAPRIEVLEHRDDADAVVLVDIGPPGEPVEAAGFVPDGGIAREALDADVRAMLAARNAQSGRPAPLDESGRFRRVPNSRAIATLESMLDALERREGTAVRFTESS
jgi:hypothetical protein